MNVLAWLAALGCSLADRLPERIELADVDVEDFWKDQVTGGGQRLYMADLLGKPLQPDALPACLTGWVPGEGTLGCEELAASPAGAAGEPTAVTLFGGDQPTAGLVRFDVRMVHPLEPDESPNTSRQLGAQLSYRFSCTTDPTLSPWPASVEATCADYTLVIAGGHGPYPNPEPMQLWFSWDPALLRADVDLQYRDFVHRDARAHLASTELGTDLVSLVGDLVMLRRLKEVPQALQDEQTRELLAAVRARRAGQEQALAEMRANPHYKAIFPGTLGVQLDLPYLARLPRAELAEEFGPALSCSAEGSDGGPGWFPGPGPLERCVYPGGLALYLSGDRVSAAHVDWGMFQAPLSTSQYGLPEAEPTEIEGRREWGPQHEVAHLAAYDKGAEVGHTWVVFR